MMNENLLYLVILILVVIVLLFYLFRLEKFSVGGLSPTEYIQTRDLVLEEVEELLKGQLEQEGNQPNDDLKDYYTELKKKLETSMDDSQLKNLMQFIQQEQKLLEIQDFLGKNNNSE